jgi:hypothetical protein
MLPDAEALLVAALRAHPTVAALPSGQRIGTRLGGVYPAIRVTLLGGPPRPAHNTRRPEFQIECCGDGTGGTAEIQASDMARTVEDIIPDLAGTYPQGTIVGAYLIGDILHSAFPDTNRERYIVQAGLIIQ